jgi:hypothetical protein
MGGQKFSDCLFYVHTNNEIYRTVVVCLVWFGSVTEGVGEWGAEEDIWPKRDDVRGEWRRWHN